MNRTDLVRCACVVRKGLTIHCGSWGLSCCLLSRAGGNRIRVPNFRKIAHAAVGKDFKDVTGSDDLIGSKYCKLQELGIVPERWPLARLFFSLQTCVDHVDRVVAGCCWEVQATRTTPSDSLTSLHEVAKCLTTVHLLCSHYWVQPIYQELLHSSSRYNATRECERKRPSSGLARVAAYQKPPKQRKP